MTLRPTAELQALRETDIRRLRHAFLATLVFAAVLLLVKIIEVLFDLDLVRYGVYPWQAGTLINVFWAPLIHGSWSHLATNTGAVIILGTVLLYGYPRSARFAAPVIYLGSGLGVWLFAREAYHIGASGLTFGMMFFVFTIGVLRWDRQAIALSLVVFLLYGGMIWGIFPGDPGVSFESHFFGALIGVLLAIMLRNRDPAPPEKKYSWEQEPKDTDNEPTTQPSGSARQDYVIPFLYQTLQLRRFEKQA